MVTVLDIDNLVWADKAIKKEGESKVKRYVLSLIRHQELSKIENKKRFRDEKAIISESHINVNPMNCDEKIIHEILGGKDKLFIKDREEVLLLKEICSELPSIQEIDALSVTDRVHIELLAHKFMESIILDDKIFDYSQGGIDVQFETFYKQVNNKKLRNLLKPIFYRLFAGEGEYFYGIKARNADIRIENITNFMCSLYKSHDLKKQRRAFTDLCAEVLYNRQSDSLSDDKIRVDKPVFQIEIEDIVIRCSAFRCMHKSHHIENILAIINILDEDGNILVRKVTAGYCRECNLYFILDSTYQELKKIGVIMCRISDEKMYAKKNYLNGESLARESLLMQYGYNVSEIDGLTKKRRHIILAIIIERKILSKSEIISYLDFFISQKRNMGNMELAVSKWEEDRLFVESYRNEEKQIIVKNIYR